MNIELINLLHEKTEIKDGHWLWKGMLFPNGYSKLRYNQSYWLVHRLSLCIYLKLKYNNEWISCHICQYKNCWNPLHLYQGTQSDNILDIVRNGNHNNSIKTHCPRGHEFNKENTRIRLSDGGRECRACHRLAQRKFHNKR